MVKNEHFRRLEHIYASELPGSKPNRVSVAFGRALLNMSLKASNSTVGEGMPHQQLMSDAAALAAGSLEKERTVTAEEFDMNIIAPNYSGEVTATARVVAAQPPRFIVNVALVTNDGEVVARGQGVYKPTTDELPPDPSPEATTDTNSDALSTSARDTDREPQPATFMPVFPTPMGVVCLN